MKPQEHPPQKCTIVNQEVPDVPGDTSATRVPSMIDRVGPTRLDCDGIPDHHDTYYWHAANEQPDGEPGGEPGGVACQDLNEPERKTLFKSNLFVKACKGMGEKDSSSPQPAHTTLLVEIVPDGYGPNVTNNKESENNAFKMKRNGTKGDMSLEWCPTEDTTNDFWTKPNQTKMLPSPGLETNSWEWSRPEILAPGSQR
jgi:hypothetical protein